MKASPERSLLVENYPALLGLPPSEGLMATGLMIERLKADHATEIAALRKLEHSYRTASRWQRVKGDKPPETDVDKMSAREFAKFRASLSND